MEQFKNPQDLAGQLIHLPESKVTQKDLNNEVRSMFKNRKEGLDYIDKNFANDEKGKQNAMARLDKVYPSTRAKWDKYFRHIGDGNPRTIDKYNRLLGEIESELPFENQKEHDKWLDLGSTWTGEEEWPNMTEEIIGRIK